MWSWLVGAASWIKLQMGSGGASIVEGMGNLGQSLSAVFVTGFQSTYSGLLFLLTYLRDSILDLFSLLSSSASSSLSGVTSIGAGMPGITSIVSTCCEGVGAGF